MTSQFQVLNKILQTKDFSMVEMNNLDEKFFFNYKAEFNYIKNHYEKHGVVPDRLTFVKAFKDFDIQDVNEPDSYLLEQLYKDYNAAYLGNRFNKIKELVENDKTNEAIDYFLKSVDNLQQGSAITCTDIFQDTSRYDRYLDRVANHDKYYISTGFKELDELIGGIDRENEDMVISARTGIGKTWTLLIMASAAAQQGMRVGIYSGEMVTDKVGYRVDTLIGKIDNKVITRGLDTSVANQYQTFLRDLKAGVYSQGKGTIKVMTPKDIAGPATVTALKAFVDKEKLDILFIDQYSLLEDTSHAQSGNERVANISKAVKNLQVIKRIPVISVSQNNRSKTDDGEHDTTQIGLSDRIGQDATCVIMLDREVVYEDPKEKTKIKDDRLILDITKSRDGGAGKLVYKADFNKGNFILLNPNEKTDVSRYEIPSETPKTSDQPF